MSGVLIRSDALPPQPWKNGGGRTRELLAWPGTTDWRVRISVADIEGDGPFSAFPGVERWFAVLKGAGVLLGQPGGPLRLTRNDAPLRFDGGDAPGCTLIDGPTRDLNLMLRGARGTMTLAEDGRDWSPQATMAGLFSAVAGRCHADGIAHDVPAYALLWFDTAPATLRFDAGERPAATTGWWIAASPAQDAA